MQKLVFLILILLLVVPGRFVYASEVEDRIKELTQKVSDLQKQENSLAQQIKLFDSKISLTTLKIDSTKAEISKLTNEIGELANEIDRLENLLTNRSELALKRVPESYKRKKALFEFDTLLLTKNFFDLISRAEYMTRVQQQDVRLLVQLKATQSHFGERKSLREQKKSQQVQLQKTLEDQTRELERQKKEKETLLAQTKNDEAVYQRLLSQALAEKTAIERALIDGVKVGQIKKGDPIALVGNSGYPGCSTGAHLHFEVRKNNAWVDPSEFLSSKSIRDEQYELDANVGNGSWSWPLEDTVRLTQRFGKTPWSWRYSYSGGIHTGFDMVSTSGTIIRAPADGELFSSSQACGSSSVIKIKYIDHGSGVVSFYLHVQ